MSSLAALRDAVVASVESQVTSFRTVKAHGGRFNRAELKRIAMQSPACLVAILGGPLEREGGSQAVNSVAVVAFIVTRGSSGVLRDRAALILAEAVANLVVQNHWSYEHSQAPIDARITNLYTGEIDRDGVALWSVSWVQRTDLAVFDADDLAALPDLDAVHVDYDLSPADGVIDFQQVIQLWGELMSAYGHINVSSAAAAAVVTPGTYVKAGGTTELNLSSDMDMPANNRLRHTGAVTKPFLVTGAASVTVDGDAKVTLAIAKNGTVDTDTATEQECTVAGGAQTIPIRHMPSLAENDYVEVWLTADAAVNVTLSTLNLMAAAT